MKFLCFLIFFPALVFAQNAPLQFGPSDLGEMVGFQNRLMFPADQNGSGSEVWTVDATGHLEILKDINPGANGSTPAHFTIFGSKLYFIATDATHGAELWMTDGTTDGTVLLKDINPGAPGSNISKLVVLPGAIYFAADDGTHGLELWKSDGTEAGTTMVKDIKAGVNGSSPHDFVSFKDSVFFAADDGVVNRELWKTNGTEAGTILVKDILSGYNGSDPQHLAVVDDMLYFSGAWGDNSAALDHVGIYKSDGTEAGTAFVIATPMYRPYYLPNLWPQEFVKNDHYVVFGYGSSNISLLNLWRLDLNTNTISSASRQVGTDMLLPYHDDIIYAGGYDPTVVMGKFASGSFTDLVSEQNSSYVPVLKSFNDKIFLVTQYYSTSKLNVYDGTNVTPQEFTNIGLGGTQMTTLNGDVYFTGMVPGPHMVIMKYDPAGSTVLNSALHAQTLTFDLPAEKQLSEGSFTLTATSSAGLPITYTSSNPSVISISGTTATLVGRGTAQITASQPGNEDYVAATPISKYVTVVQREITVNGTLTFGTVNVGDSQLRTYEIKSTGADAVTISGIDYPVGYIGFIQATATGWSVLVTFAPTEAKDYNGTVVIHSNAVGPNTLPISGKGKALIDGLPDEANGFNIFPNPVERTLNIRFEEVEFTASIADMQGRILKQFRNTSAIDVSDLSEGIYLLICSGTERHITRFSKK